MSERCPHLIYRDVLGPAAVARLLEFACSREHAFRPSLAYDRQSGETVIDASRRDCMLLDDLGPFEEAVRTFVRGIAGPALARLRLDERPGETRELEISAYGDGGHFNAHIDTVDAPNRVRVLSCVYYFAASPRRFRGGALRLYALPSLAGKSGGARAFVDVEPETDTLVAFPSWLRHEVLPVTVPSGAWADRRFAINAWVHRAGG